MVDKKEKMKSYYKIDNFYNFITELKYLTENINNHYSSLIVNQKNVNEKFSILKINFLNNDIDKVIKQEFETCLSLINSTLYSLNNISADEMDFINKDEGLNKIKSVNFIDIISDIDSKIASALNKIHEFSSESDNQLPIIKNDLNQLNSIKESIANTIRNYIEFLSNLYNTTNNTILLNSETFNNYYLKKFEQETSLILKKYQNSVSNITEKYENQFQNFILDQDKAIKSANLFSKSVNDGLKDLVRLNERTQNIELEFSKIIGIETTKVKEDLDGSRIALIGVVDSITIEATTKLNEINTAHSDFKNLVEKAGIYELTQNYKTKANEEKKDYKLNMWLTIGAIVLAIIATIVVITIPIIEHWKANPAVDMDYFTLFARLSISIMFFVLALYTSKQAAKHYECYQENHRTFLQLAALEPFMTRMSHDEQKEIRKGLIPSYFNQGSDGKFTAKGDEVDLPTNMYAIVNRAFDLVSEKKEPKAAESTVAESKPQG